MSEIVISCENLSKQYRLGQRESYKALRDTLTDILYSPFRRLRAKSKDTNAAANPTFWALKDVSFDVRRGEVVGIIGRNGAGKSTLLKILSRITKPTEGQVRLKGRVGSLLEVGTGFHPELSGRENIYLNGTILGMRKTEIEKKFDEIVAFAEIEKFLDTPVKRYSSGMYVRLAFAVAAHLEPEILIVDEVLAVGDAQFQKKCMGKLSEAAHAGRTVIFVSHNMSAIKSLCQKGLLLNSGQVAFSGTVEDAVREYSLHSVAPAQSVVDFSGRSVERYGPQEYAVLRGLKLLNSQGQPESVLQMGETVHFLLSLDIHKPTDELDIGIGIFNLQDVAVHYFISGWEGFKGVQGSGLHTIKVELPHVHMFPGEYQIYIWVSRRGYAYDDAIHEALRFSVEENQVNEHATYFTTFSRNTQVYVPTKWELIDNSKF